MAEVHWVLRLGEVTLKSKPVRRLFQNAMRRSMSKAERRWDVRLRLSFGRDRVVVRSDGPVERVEKALAHQFGIVAVDRVRMLGDPDDISNAAEAILERHHARGTPRFGVRCHGQAMSHIGPRRPMLQRLVLRLSTQTLRSRSTSRTRIGR